MAIRPRRWLLGALAALLTLALASGTYLRFAAVPIHQLDESWYRENHRGSEPFDPKVHADFKWTILRAQLDHVVSPIPRARRFIQFIDTWQDAKGHIYLRFWGRMHVLVVYCLSQDRRLLWKADEDHSA
jgi:hypothetical protein